MIGSSFRRLAPLPLFLSQHHPIHPTPRLQNCTARAALCGEQPACAILPGSAQPPVRIEAAVCDPRQYLRQHPWRTRPAYAFVVITNPDRSPL